MRAAFVTPVATLGGAERSLVDIWAALRGLDPSLDLHMVCGQADGPLYPLADALGVTAHRLPMTGRVGTAGDASGVGLGRATDLLAAGVGAVGYAARLRRLLTRLAPRVVHTNGLRCHLLCGPARPARAGVVWHVRDFVSSRPVVGRLLRYARPAGAVVLANSDAVTADVRRAVPAADVRTVHNGIDLTAFRPDGPAADLDALAGLSAARPDTVRVGLVATYARWKGHDVFLAAARLGAANTRWYVVGGPTYQTTGSQFSRAELDASAGPTGVGFVPFQHDPAGVFRGLDVVVHASTKPEPFGRVIVEGMACGRAVVATLAGGVGELVTPGVDAETVRPNDPAALAAAVNRLAADPTRRAELGRAAAAAARRFSREAAGARVLTVYRELAGRP
jgi:glycosyltransferase involved in cell wall biosynthesis